MINDFFARNRELGLVLLMLVILFVLFAPIPPAVLDLALVMNFGLSLAILLLTFYVSKPVEFSTFPSLLLIATLFRLGINIASTRLILTGADAGDVIRSIGTFSMSGNFVVGLVVFGILVVVQFIVVTSGAQRVSEVAARFTLDSMPGQQMSIDADLNMGLIDQKEAVARRKMLEKEASFYGAMDGASKFVKGDAIAGIIIVLINIIAGIIIGAVQMGMTWGEAVETFSLLTVGDGIATQVPALVIAIATGIIVTRSSADRDLATEVFAQVLSAPKAILSVCGILMLMLMLPGMPKWPMLVVAACAIGIIIMWRRRLARAAEEEAFGQTEDLSEARPVAERFPAVSLLLGPMLAERWKESKAVLLDRIETIRDGQERDLGIAFPPVSIKDGSGLGTYEYEVRLLGTRYATGEARPGLTLAIRGAGNDGKLGGIAWQDSSDGRVGEWIEPGKAGDLGPGWTTVDDVTLVMGHLADILRAEAAMLLTRATTVRLLDSVRQLQPGLVEEIVPTLLTVSDIQRVLQGLVSEGVGIGNIELIVEHLADLGRIEKDTGNLIELLRQRMALSICNGLRGRQPDLSVLILDPKLESQISLSIAQSGRREGLGIDPRLAQRLLDRLRDDVGAMERAGRTPTLLSPGDLRRPLRALTRREFPRLAILAHNEIPPTINLTPFGIVRIDVEAEPVPRNASGPEPGRQRMLEGAETGGALS